MSDENNNENDVNPPSSEGESGDSAPSGDAGATSHAEDAKPALHDFLPRKTRDNRKKTSRFENDDPADDISNAQDEIDQAVKASAYKTQRDQKRLTLMKWGGGTALLLTIGWWLFAGSGPQHGSVFYAVCRNFLELNVTYPDTLRITEVIEHGTYVRIWFTQTDAFGQYRLEPIQCHFEPDDEYGWMLERITIRRRDVDQDKVEAFKKIVPILYNNPPPMVIPPPPADKLQHIRYNFNPFWKTVL